MSGVAARLVFAAWTVLAAAVAALACASFASAQAHGPPAADLRPTRAQLDRGRELYDFHCTTCHGATGAGFAEARAAFPADHYDCFRCHGRRNPPTMTRHQIETSQTVFSLGDPPALADSERLARYGTIGALLDHVRTTMPRWQPGRLEDDEYRDVVLYVLSLAYDDLRTGDVPLDATTLRGIRLGGER